jgi:hypothetical protein
VNAEDAEAIGRFRYLHVLDERLFLPLLGNLGARARWEKDEQSLAGVVDVHLGSDASLRCEQECVDTLAVSRGHPVRDGVVHVIQSVVAGHDQQVVGHLDNASAVSDRRVRALGAAVMQHSLAATAVGERGVVALVNSLQNAHYVLFRAAEG